MHPTSRKRRKLLLPTAIVLLMAALAATVGVVVWPPSAVSAPTVATVVRPEGAVSETGGEHLAAVGAPAESAEATAAQYRRRRRVPPRYPAPNAPIDGAFTFARIEYTSVRGEPLGTGWTTDYPDGDVNFMRRFDEFTTSPVAWDRGWPDHVVVTLYDEELFKYPFIFMSDVGTIGLDPVEVERLRQYLLRGGFLWVDDFWGWAAWDQWVYEIGRVLPPEEYPILDVSADHPIRQMLYPIDDIPQIPSIQWYRRSGGYTTSERGSESATPHLRHISDPNGRMMVLMSHNTDIADGWERENEDFDFFNRFSFPAYAVGINVVLYARSH